MTIESHQLCRKSASANRHNINNILSAKYPASYRTQCGWLAEIGLIGWLNEEISMAIGSRPPQPSEGVAAYLISALLNNVNGHGYSIIEMAITIQYPANAAAIGVMAIS
jgi:hypothetical protein